MPRGTQRRPIDGMKGIKKIDAYLFSALGLQLQAPRRGIVKFMVPIQMKGELQEL
jgi:hypothetical protein